MSGESASASAGAASEAARGESPYAYVGNDVDTLRKRYFHQVLVFTHVDQCDRWFDIVADVIERYCIDAKIDLDFVLGKSTDGVFYFQETSEIYEAAVTMHTATKDQMEQCFPRPIHSRGYKKRTQQMKKFLSDLRAVQKAEAQEGGDSQGNVEAASSGSGLDAAAPAEEPAAATAHGEGGEGGEEARKQKESERKRRRTTPAAPNQAEADD